MAQPVNAKKTSTGLLGATASSSASVGKRFSANWAGFQPPIAVMNLPGLAVLVRADCRLHVGNRRRGLEPRVVAGARPEEQKVIQMRLIEIIDETASMSRPCRV